MAGKIFGIIIYILIIMPVSVLAEQETVFRIDMNSLNLQKGVSSNVVISLENAPGAQILNIEGLEEFDMLSKSQSTSTTFTNGVTTQRIDMYYTIMPKTTGQFSLKANVIYNGSNYETNVLQVTVREASDDANESAGDYFIKTSASHTEAYLGEKIVLTYELYSRYRVDSFFFMDTIAIDGVITKELSDDQLRYDDVYIDGDRYEVYKVGQLIIDPIKSGVCTISSHNIQVNVITNSHGFGLFNSYTPVYLQSEKMELMVKPLPLEGRPKDYSGIVGELQLDGNYSREEMNYGDSFALYATVYGNCNLDGLQSIINREIPGISVYETQKNMTESVEDNRYYSQKAFEAILVPERTGVFNVAPISISYFNTITEKYEKVEIPGANIEVLGDMPQPGNYGGSFAGNIETLAINQVNYANANDGYFTVQMKKEWVYAMLAGFAASIILAAAFIWLFSNRKKQNQELKSLYRQLMGAKDINEAYNLFNAMIKHCYNISLKSSSRNMIRMSLPDAELAEQVTHIMDYIENSQNHDEKRHIYLKNKIGVIYRMLKPVC